MKLLWNLLTEPDPQIKSPDKRWRARFAASAFLLSASLILIHILIDLVAVQYLSPVHLVALSVVIVVQRLSRGRYVEWAIPTGLFTLWVMSPLSLELATMDMVSLRLLIIWPVLVVIITAHFYRRVYAFLVMVVSIIGIAISMSTTSNIFLDNLFFSISLTLQLGILSVVFSFLNRTELREKSRTLLENGAEERRLRQIIDHVAEIVVKTDTDLIIEYVNQTSVSVLGYEASEFEGRSLHVIFELMHPDDRSKMIAMLGEVMSARKAILTEYRLRHADGHYVWLESLSNFIYSPEGRLEAVLFTGRDISDRKQSEVALQRQRMLAEALRNSASALTERLDRTDILDRILEQAQTIFNADSVNLMMFEGDELYMASARGYDALGANTEAVKQIRVSRDQLPIVVRMLETRTPMVIPDVRESSDFVQIHSADWIRAYASAPIELDGEIIGLLQLDSAEAGRFDDATATHLQSFAYQAAIAIRNTELYAQVKRDAAVLDALVHERTATLEQERRQLKAILNAMTEGVAYVESTDGTLENLKILYINRALSEISGYSGLEWQEAGTGLMIPVNRSREENDQFVIRLVETLLRNEIWREEFQLRRKDGTQFHAAITTTRVDDASGNMKGTVTVVRDVSQEKALEEQRSRFIAHASHELRTPITNLITRLYLLRKRPDALNEHADILDEVTNRMKRLVDDLLDMSQLERGTIRLKRQPLALQKVLQAVVRVQGAEAEHKSIALELDVPLAPLMIEGDENRLTQVITNLVVNAINYTPESGQVVLRLRPLTATHCAEVIVEDTGPGIPSEHIGQIFQPFFRVPNESGVKGSGLGLAIAHELVGMHEGAIRVESREGEGSRFIIELPLMAE
jgi:PAS domain S-box-containing protein